MAASQSTATPKTDPNLTALTKQQGTPNDHKAGLAYEKIPKSNITNYSFASQVSFWGDKAKDGTQFKAPFDDRTLIKILTDAKIDKNAKILDAGCGYGRNLRVLDINGYKNIVGIDSAPDMIIKGKQELPHLADKLQLGQVNKTSLPDASVDVVVLFNVLTCNKDDSAQTAIIEEMQRVMKPGGFIYISDYLISQHPDMQEIYNNSKNAYNQYGVYEFQGGAVCRDSTPEWFNRLLKNFNVVWEKKNFDQLLGNKSTPFQVIARYNPTLEKEHIVNKGLSI